MGCYSNVEIVYGYRVEDAEIDWDYFAEKYKKEMEEEDYCDDIEEYFHENIVSGYWHYPSYCGENFDECNVFGDALEYYSGYAVTPFDPNILNISDERKEKIAKDFKETFPFLSDKEPGYYVLVSYD